MTIDPKHYPNIHWRWRVFAQGSFLGYILATLPELMESQNTIKFSVDREHLAIDLL